MFLQKNDVLETIFRNGNFSITKAKLDGPISEYFLQFRNSRRQFHRCASFGAVDYYFGKRQFLCGFGDSSSLGQKLPFGTKVTVFGIKLAVLRINRRFRGRI